MKRERQARVRYYFEIRGLADGSGERVQVNVDRFQSRPPRFETMKLSIPFSRYARFITSLEDQTRMCFLGTYTEYAYKTRSLAALLREYAVSNGHLAECFARRRKVSSQNRTPVRRATSAHLPAD